MAANFIMLDFDSGSMTKEILLAAQQEDNFDSYIYSSQNHQRQKIKADKIELPCDRLRKLIPLKEPITEENDRKAVERHFVNQYNQDMSKGIDESFMDKSRYFAHGTDEVASFKDGQGALDWKALPLNFDSTDNKTESDYHKPKDTFRLNDLVTDSNGQPVRIKDMKTGDRIVCPFCGDSDFRTNPGSVNSATLKNKEGLPIIYCHSCKSRGMGHEGVYNLHPDDIFVYMCEKQKVYVFIDTVTSKYYSLCVEPGVDEFVVRPLGNLDAVKQFRAANELPEPRAYPRARYEMKFDRDEVISFEHGFVNKYIPTEYLKTPIPSGYKAAFPDNIQKVIFHVFGSDKTIIQNFINDLANFIQTRHKMITSYLVQGVEGTGKGFLFVNVFQPIFGERFCCQTSQDAFEGKFNSFLTDNVFVMVNEVSGNFSISEQKNLSMIEKMKIAITDEYIQIEGKNKDRVNGKNNCSFLFATNRMNGVVLSASDRRFNVAPRQEIALNKTNWWPGYNQLKAAVASELQEFVWFLKQYPVNKNAIGTVIDNEPKRLLQIMSQSNAEEFFENLKAGDKEWFLNHIVVGKGYGAQENYNKMEYRITGWDSDTVISLREITDVYNNINQKSISVVAFGKLAAGKMPKPKTYRCPGDNVWGIKINWK